MERILVRFALIGSLAVAPLPASAANSNRATLTVFGIDRTEPANRGMTTAGIAVVDQSLRSLATRNDDDGMVCAPVDGRCQIEIRWISDVSYAPSELVADVSLPAMDQPASAFDGTGKRRLFTELRARSAELAHGLHDIHAAQPDPKGTSRTDLYGFLQAAAEYFSQSTTAHKMLVYISDLEDNENFGVTPNLQGVDVRIYTVAWRADPVAMQRLQMKWRKILMEKCRARSVAFLPLPITSHTQ